MEVVADPLSSSLSKAPTVSALATKEQLGSGSGSDEGAAITTRTSPTPLELLRVGTTTRTRTCATTMKQPGSPIVTQPSFTLLGLEGKQQEQGVREHFQFVGSAAFPPSSSVSASIQAVYGVAETVSSQPPLPPFVRVHVPPSAEREVECALLDSNLIPASSSEQQRQRQQQQQQKTLGQFIEVAAPSSMSHTTSSSVVLPLMSSGLVSLPSDHDGVVSGLGLGLGLVSRGGGVALSSSSSESLDDVKAEEESDIRTASVHDNSGE